METILLLENEEDRVFVMGLPIVIRCMVNSKSIGSWFTAMLQSQDRVTSQRAVEYLKRVSNQVSIGTDCDDPKTNQPNDSFPLIDAFSSLNEFVPAMLALGNQGMEEVSTTLIVRGVLDRMISKPFAVTVVICDAVFLTTMILGIRLAVNNLVFGHSLTVVLKWIYLANTGVFYFITREIGKMVAMLSISKQARSYFLSFWNLIDSLAVLLALASTVSIRYHFDSLEQGLGDASMLRRLLAITTGFLWLRVLSFLKAINEKLATFVLAILQITKASKMLE